MGVINTDNRDRCSENIVRGLLVLNGWFLMLSSTCCAEPRHTFCSCLYFLSFILFMYGPPVHSVLLLAKSSITLVSIRYHQCYIDPRNNHWMCRVGGCDAWTPFLFALTKYTSQMMDRLIRKSYSNTCLWSLGMDAIFVRNNEIHLSDLCLH